MNVVKRKVFFQAYNTHDQFETVVLYSDSLVPFEFRSYNFEHFLLLSCSFIQILSMDIGYVAYGSEF